MSRSVYKWDIEELNFYMNRLNEARETLEENKASTIGFKEEVETSWQSLSGEIYKDEIEIDLKNYETVIADLKEKSDTLNRIANSYYRNCEEAIRTRISGINIEG